LSRLSLDEAIASCNVDDESRTPSSAPKSISGAQPLFAFKITSTTGRNAVPASLYSVEYVERPDFCVLKRSCVSPRRESPRSGAVAAADRDR
jgi:hypothetical protein